METFVLLALLDLAGVVSFGGLAGEYNNAPYT
jgi:hypothetical protein